MRTPARDLAFIAVFAGVTAALGLLPPLPVPWTPVPVTGQSLGVILAGAVLGARRGGLSQVLFLALVALGLPLLAGGRGGLGAFAGPSVGFLIGFAVVPFVIGWATERAGRPYRFWVGLGVNLAFGIGLLYVFGLVGMMAMAGLSLPAALLANLPYLPGDALKVVVATLVARGVHAAYPGLFPARDRRREAR